MQIADIVALAKGGRTVLVIPETQDAAAALFETIDPEALSGVTHLRRSRGRELVQFGGGGSLHFVSAGSVRAGGARGRTVDVVFVDHRVAHDPGDALLQELEPCIASTRGTLVVVPMG